LIASFSTELIKSVGTVGDTNMRVIWQTTGFNRIYPPDILQLCHTWTLAFQLS